jgi:hypothetical protein
MSEPAEVDVKVRRQVAAEHGLDWRAAKLLVGSTIPELEQSAVELANAQKAERRRTLVDALCGRRPRDGQGRYAKVATDLGGGARQSVPLPPPTHGETLSELFRTRAADVGHRL